MPTLSIAVIGQVPWEENFEFSMKKVYLRAYLCQNLLGSKNCRMGQRETISSDVATTETSVDPL